MGRGRFASAFATEPPQPRQPSRCPGQDHTRNQRSPEGANHRPLHEAVSGQWSACIVPS